MPLVVKPLFSTYWATSRAMDFSSLEKLLDELHNKSIKQIEQEKHK
jgi:hypothetical protein